MYRNPFTPTFGMVPPILAGRDSLLNVMEEAFKNWPGDPNLCSILVGPRGSGKTALLSCIGDEARKSGWIVADTVANDGMLDDILQRTIDAASNAVNPKSKKKLTGLTVGQVLGITWDDKESPEEPNWRSKMTDILRELGRDDIGLLITVDEVRADTSEMIQLASTYQLFVRDNLKVALVMAGLPSHVNDLISNEVVSFLRRAKQHYVGKIPNSDIRNAFRETIKGAGKNIEPEALDKSVDAAAGFAYMMQLVGYEVWNANGDNKTITEEDASEGIRYAKADFKDGVLNSTYRELSNGDRAFLNAMLPDDGESSLTDIAKRMGKSTGYAHTYKVRLLKSGVIEETPSQRLIFALPGMRDYIENVK